MIRVWLELFSPSPGPLMLLSNAPLWNRMVWFPWICFCFCGGVLCLSPFVQEITRFPCPLPFSWLSSTSSRRCWTLDASWWHFRDYYFDGCVQSLSSKLKHHQLFRSQHEFLATTDLRSVDRQTGKSIAIDPKSMSPPSHRLVGDRISHLLPKMPSDRARQLFSTLRDSANRVTASNAGTLNTWNSQNRGTLLTLPALPTGDGDGKISGKKYDRKYSRK